MKEGIEEINQLIINKLLDEHKAEYPEPVHNKRSPRDGDCFYNARFNRCLCYKNGKWEVQK